ncbi:hypothetical protein Aph02nite_68630 [Actinoplanes philippinensis]|nr:hypothetical protein Aph02nite_68630 [Actinoplanes philippinensis]
MKSTIDTANENFITDQGSMRFRFSRARRGPRAAADDTVERADRTASETRAAPTAAAPPAGGGVDPVRCFAAPGVVAGGAGGVVVEVGRCGVPGAAAGALTGVRPEVVPGAAPLPLVTTGTEAEPFTGGCTPGRLSAPSVLPAAGSPGGGAMPGALVNFGGDGASAGTEARPVVSRPAGAAASFFAASSGVAEVPGPPDFACVSGIN